MRMYGLCIFRIDCLGLPELDRRITREGHEIGTHGYDDNAYAISNIYLIGTATVPVPVTICKRVLFTAITATTLF